VAPEKDLEFIRKHESILTALVRIDKILYSKEEVQLSCSSTALIGRFKVMIPLPEELKEKERVRLVKEQEKLIIEQNKLRLQLANQDFLQKAPPQLVDKLKAQADQTENELLHIAQKMEQLRS
jgi:valyl-tRNA synthetase